MKYLPVLPAILALSIVATGGFAFALAAMAITLTAMTYALAVELTTSRRTAAIAAVLMAISPLVIVQSALALPYLPFALLIELTWLRLLSASRTHSTRALLAAGFAGALAFTLRPFDALLLLLPTLVWLVVTRRDRWSLTIRLAAGAALPVGGMLWYCWAATGSPWKLPFSLFSPQDTLGFGIHRLYPGEAARHFGPGQGWQGLLRDLSLLSAGWAFGGIVLFALCAVGLRRYRLTPAVWLVLSGGALLGVGYLFFWGVWNAAVLWGGTRYLGPYYLLPLLIPCSVLGAVGLEVVASRSRLACCVAVVAAATISSMTITQALKANDALNADNGALAAAVASQGNALVFVDTYPNYLQHPSAVVANASPPGGRTVYAIDRGQADFAVARAFPHRNLYRLQMLGEYGHTPHKGFGARLEHLRLVTARAFVLLVQTNPGGTQRETTLVVSAGSKRVSASVSRRNQITRVALSAIGSPAIRADRQGLYGLRSLLVTVTLSLMGADQGKSHLIGQLRPR